MLTPSLFMLGGLVLLAGGAEGLVRGSSALALRLGVTPLVVGLTVVAFGTGSPELFVSVEASARGEGGIALGNVVGSNISNVALILGLSALARPMKVRSELIRREVPLMIAVTLLLCLLLLDGTLSRVEGLILAAGSIAYTAFAYLAARRDRSKAVAEEFEEALAGPKRAAWVDVVLVVAGFALLLVGARLLLSGATAVAERFGVSQVVIGLTIVAIGTSLPELATSFVASLRGEADVAFGNAIGSNILNILLVLGVAAMIRPVEAQGLRPLDLGAMVASAVLLLPLMWRGWVLNRWEGALLLAGYVAYLYSVVS
ncbi:MAG TPA: calcium/sodium antiporter [Pyrinomonadaceae bacterium]|nr:calcium/sodium antiporter [Pyrinomonadaceae bacterium]